MIRTVPSPHASSTGARQISLPAPSTDAVALITGASAGIGSEFARQLAAMGHNVTLVARRRERLDELAHDLQNRHGVTAAVHAADLGDASARHELIEAVRAGGKHVAALVNNAGFGSFGRFQTMPKDRELAMVELNVVALTELTGAFVPAMVERGAGAILNVGSTAGFQPMPGNVTYAATKAYVNSFSEGLHHDLAGTGVSCTVLCPGPVRTEFVDSADSGEAVESLAPSFTWADPDDVARVAIRGMVKGKRMVVPNMAARAQITTTRHAPHSVLLPLISRALGSRLDRQR
jgi:short-subunit dehydrogenase